jgi:DNA anti-recombination protein RmuC
MNEENPTRPTLDTILERINALGQETKTHFDEMRQELSSRLDAMRQEMNNRFDETNKRIDETNQRIEDFRVQTSRELRALERQFNSVAGEMVRWRTVCDDIESRLTELEASRH